MGDNRYVMVQLNSNTAQPGSYVRQDTRSHVGQNFTYSPYAAANQGSEFYDGPLYPNGRPNRSGIPAEAEDAKEEEKPKIAIKVLGKPKKKQEKKPKKKPENKSDAEDSEDEIDPVDALADEVEDNDFEYFGPVGENKECVAVCFRGTSNVTLEKVIDGDLITMTKTLYKKDGSVKVLKIIRTKDGEIIKQEVEESMEPPEEDEKKTSAVATGAAPQQRRHGKPGKVRCRHSEPKYNYQYQHQYQYDGNTGAQYGAQWPSPPQMRTTPGVPDSCVHPCQQPSIESAAPPPHQYQDANMATPSAMLYSVPATELMQDSLVLNVVRPTSTSPVPTQGPPQQVQWQLQSPMYQQQ